MAKDYINTVAEMQHLLQEMRQHPDLSVDDRIALGHISIEVAAALSIINKLYLEKECI